MNLTLGYSQKPRPTSEPNRSHLPELPDNTLEMLEWKSRWIVRMRVRGARSQRIFARHETDAAFALFLTWSSFLKSEFPKGTHHD